MSLRESFHRCLFASLRAVFRALPLGAATRDRLRQRFLARHGGLVPAGPRGQVIAAASAHRPRLRSGARAIGYMDGRPQTPPAAMPATVVAFHLPQFHAIPENDAWWGQGFTEWRNVTRALPQFEGHVQPRLPGALGYYDLGHADALRAQMELARAYGVGAFCSYFYWFGGKTLLEAPLHRWLADPTLTLPLCLCWANENWSRRWDGREGEVLIGQCHSADDDLAFIAHVAPYLKDPRYLRVAGKPMLLVYRPGLLPDAKATATRWRAWCRAHDVGEIQLAYVQSFDRVDPRALGFDAAVAFPPNNVTLPAITARQRLLNPAFHGDVHDWRELARQAMAAGDPPYPLYPTVNPGWDNEPRRSGRGRVFLHASPRAYGAWLRHAVATARRRFASQPLVFVNAWNEWAEGAVLEPDARLGHAWLQATHDALCPEPTPDPRPCAILHVWYPELLDELVAVLRAGALDWRVILTTAKEREDAVRGRIRALALDAELQVFENRGRDILPFLHVANRLLDERVDVVLKLHTKRSAHRHDGDTWRHDLLHKLASADRARRIVAAFAAHPRLGLVAAEGHVQPLGYYWGANQDNVRYLATRIGIAPPDAQRDRFVAGSMFWVRLAALRPLLDAHLGTDEFEPEAGQLDGTFAHAIERVFTLACAAAGHDWCDAADAVGESAPESSAPYPYARRSD